MVISSELLHSNHSLRPRANNHREQAPHFIFKRTKHRRLEDCFNDIPDSDPDSDDVDHPLEKAGYLSKREINQILAVKIKKLKELYKAELNAVNNDLIRYIVHLKNRSKTF